MWSLIVVTSVMVITQPAASEAKINNRVEDIRLVQQYVKESTCEDHIEENSGIQTGDGYSEMKTATCIYIPK